MTKQLLNKDCFFLLDTFTKNTIKTNTADWVVNGVTFITELNDLESVLGPRSSTVFIMESFMHNVHAYSEIRLYKNIFPVEFIFIGLDKELLNSVRPYGRVFISDVSTITYDVLLAALYQDQTSESNEDASNELFDDSLEYANNLLKQSPNHSIFKLASDFINLVVKNRSLKKRIDDLQSSMQYLQHSNSSIKEQNQKLVAGYADLLKESQKLNNVLRDYEDILTRDIYSKIDLSLYPNKPMIIYFKEYEELLNFDTFIRTLFDLFRMHDQNSVKVLLLFDSSTSRRMKVLPDYVHVLHNQYYAKDIILSDFIAKSGDYTKVLELLLANKSMLNILLIFDCKSANDVTIVGPYLPFNLCRDASHLEAFGLPKENTIVNKIGSDEGNEALVFKDCSDELDKIDDLNDQFLYLSNLKVFQRILELTRLYKGNLN